MRIKGNTEGACTPQAEKIMRDLGLRDINNAVFLKANAETLDRLIICQKFIAYGYPTKKTVNELLRKRGFLKKDGKKEAITPPDIVNRLLAAAGEDMVLVGGQALAFWVLRYELVIPSGHAAISSDTDFLAVAPHGRALVERMAEVIHGQALFPSRRALTALVGQAVRPISDDEFVNVDVIDSVIGIAEEDVRSRAVHATVDGQSFLVMHPLHVLRSRLANIYMLTEKQGIKGEMQLAFAIDVAR